jgi:hypothetical protein
MQNVLQPIDVTAEGAAVGVALVAAAPIRLTFSTSTI